MKIAFVDPGPIDYTVATPLHRPLGGMPSGLCYLATELARRGHEVRLLNRTTTPGTLLGVRCEALDPARIALQLAGVDWVISIRAEAAALIRSAAKRSILWTGHDVDEPTMIRLRDPEEASIWDLIVFKSDWQAQRYLTETAVDPGRCRVIGNAVSPAFLETDARTSFFFELGRDPVLHYSSTPFRGLEVLLRAFPIVRAQVPGCELIVCSSMEVYQRRAEADRYAALYEICRKTPGVTYRGSLPQPELAEVVRSSDILAYPSTFAETSCVTLMEAMTTGCLTVSTSLGALPETSAGFGFFIEPDRAGPSGLARRFATGLLGAIHVARSRPAQMRGRLLAQSAHARKSFDWRARADQWERLLEGASLSANLVLFPSEPIPLDPARGIAATPADDRAPASPSSTTRNGRRIHLDAGDARARRLQDSGGDFNPLTSAIWRALLSLRAWTHVFDVGANYGEMLVDARISSKAKVIAFEPNPAVLPFLRRTLSELGGVDLIEAALSSTVGDLPFFIDRHWSGMSRVDREGRTPFRVPSMTLDGVLAGMGCEWPDISLLLKIDVEGHERAVLEGGRQSIGRLGAFAALIEIAHLDDPDRDWLSRHFRLAGLCLETRRLVELESLSAQRLAEQRVHDQDVVVFRQGRHRSVDQ